MAKSKRNREIYSRTNRPQIGPRTLNAAEITVAQQLEAAGYEVIKRGWPDFIAVRGNEVRLIEVKPSPHRELSPQQRRVAEILHRAFGIAVELARPPFGAGRM